MNKEYIYSEGKVIIRDYDDNQKQIVYYDNLDDVLVLENVIELTEERINLLEKLKNEIARFNKQSKKNILATILASIAIPVAMYGLIIYVLFPNYSQALYAFDELKRLILGVGTVFSLIGLGSSLIGYFDYKATVKHENGLNSELNQMELTLNSMKERVKELQKCKTTNYEDKEFKIVPVYDAKVMQVYQDEFDFYYNCGYNKDKYRKYYELGELFKKLKSEYSEEEIGKIEAYLENEGTKVQGPRISKKRVFKK